VLQSQLPWNVLDHQYTLQHEIIVARNTSDGGGHALKVEED
jgi:hypothetical protein